MGLRGFRVGEVRRRLEEPPADHKRDRRLRTAHDDLDADIRRMRIHVRARAARVANGIDDRVFGFQRDELGVAQLLVSALRAHREGRPLLDERGPRKGAHAG